MSVNPVETPWLRRLTRRSAPTAHLVAIHHAGGGTAAFRQWGALLAEDVELWAVVLPGREGRFSEPIAEDLGVVADQVANALTATVPSPYVLFGHSMGALIAYEVAHRLRDEHPPRHLIVAGSPAPHLVQDQKTAEDSEEEFRERLRSLNGTPDEVLRDVELMELLLPTIRADFELVDRYRWSGRSPLDVPVTALSGADDPGVSLSDLEAWAMHTTGRSQLKVVEGDHFFVNTAVEEVIELVSRALEKGKEPSGGRLDPRVFEPNLNAEEHAFADRVAQILDVQEAREYADAAGTPHTLDPRPLYRLLGRHGLLAPHWPTRFGGAGRTVVETSLVHEALVRRRLPDLAFVVTISYVGTLLQMAGSDRLLASYLPGLASGDLLACTLYSEPGVGSDLASLQTAAVPEPGGLRVSGRKVYSQVTDLADFAVVAVRIGPRGKNPYEGIALLWIPLDQPGIERRRVDQLGADPFTDVVLNGVHVPDDHVLADGASGWAMLNEALAIERTGYEAYLRAEQSLAVGPRPHSSHGGVDQLEALVRAAGAMAWRQVRDQAAGELDPGEAAASKWFSTELAAPLARRAYDRATNDGRDEAYQLMLEAPGMTLSAGTSEMMLATIASTPGALLTRRRAGAVGVQIRSVLDDLMPLAQSDEEGVLRPVKGADPEQVREAFVDAGLFELTLPVDTGGVGLPLTVGSGLAEELGSRQGDHDLLRSIVVAEWLAHWPQLGQIALLRRLCAGEVTVTGWRRHDDASVVVATSPDLAEHLVTVCPGALEDLQRRHWLRRASYACGSAAEALRLAHHHTRRRQQFGRALINNQYVSFSLAELSARLAAVRELVRHDTEFPLPDGAAAASAVCAQATDLALDAAEAALHFHGAAGLVRGSAVEGLYRHLLKTLADSDPLAAH